MTTSTTFNAAAGARLSALSFPFSVIPSLRFISPRNRNNCNNPLFFQKFPEARVITGPITNGASRAPRPLPRVTCTSRSAYLGSAEPHLFKNTLKRPSPRENKDGGYRSVVIFLSSFLIVEVRVRAHDLPRIVVENR